MMPGEFELIENWVPIEGIWQQDHHSITFTGVDDSEESGDSPRKRGIALSGTRFSSGRIKACITLPEEPRRNYGHILIGFMSLESRFISIGIGGQQRAYGVGEYLPGSGWNLLQSTGSAANLEGNRPYFIEVGLDGQRLTLSVDSVKLLDYILNGSLSREQVGLYSQGDGPIKFESVGVSTEPYAAFVVMQFTPQFDMLFDEVIRPVCEGLGISAYRASDIYRPGVILQDILQGLDGSNVVIADVTPANPNVFYELGYSHAFKKPVILLAERDTPLPFDISGYRVIFYDNTIGGKSAVETDLRSHLTSILGE